MFEKKSKRFFCFLLVLTLLFTSMPPASINAAVPSAPATAWAYKNAISVKQTLSNPQEEHWYKLIVTEQGLSYKIALSTPSDVRYSLTLYNSEVTSLATAVGQSGKASLSRSLQSGTYYIKIASADGSISTQQYSLQTTASPFSYFGGSCLMAPGGQSVEVSGGSLYIDGERVSNFSWSDSYYYNKRPAYGMDYEDWSQSISESARGVIVDNIYRVGSYSGYRIGTGTVSSSNAVEIKVRNLHYDYYYYQSIAMNSKGEVVRDSTRETIKEDCEDEFIRVIIDVDTKKVIDTDLNYAYWQFNRKNSFTNYSFNVPVPLTEADAPTGFAVDIKNEKVTGVSNLMEYSTNGTSWTEITGDELNISSIIPAATASSDLTLKIRLKKSETFLASQATEIVIPRRIATPLAANVRFEGISETILLSDTMEYRMGTTGNYTTLEEGKTYIDVTVDNTAKSYQIRVKATDEKFASVPLTVKVVKRAAAPAVVYTAASDAITGVSTAMEYSLDGGLTWISATEKTIPRSVFGNETALVKVRVKATATAAKSEIKDVTVPDGPTNAPTGFSVDIKNEKVTGVSNLMEYSTNGTSWKAITGDTLDISTIIPVATATSDLLLKIRVKATTTVPASQIAEVLITRRVATPLAANVKFEGTSETILLSDTMEYRLGTTGDYTSVEEGKTCLEVTVDSVAKTYQIRVKATDEKFASLPLTVTVVKRAAAPAAVYTAASDAITGVTTAM
ncbi:hypothetical protein, partial [Anaerosporobacter sp.]|uniref:hypothetical protein n=1 Tax=Anaerosporobacter sp. TaxID=1872529 RepID=UPI00286EBDAE